MGVLDVLTVAANIAKESGKLELQGELLGIYEKLLEQQRKISEIELENKDLKDKLKTKDNLTFDRNSYWLKVGENSNGPFCSCCWDYEEKTIRMQPCGYNPAYYDCPKCQNKNVEIYPERSSTNRQFNGGGMFN